MAINEILIEVLVRILLSLVSWYLNKWKPQIVNRLSLADISNHKKPRKPSTINFQHLLITSILLPLSIFTIGANFDVFSIDILTAFLGLTLSLTLTSLITNYLKVLVQRPRPDFLARCYPNTTYYNLTEKCTGNVETVSDGCKSFPSGHSSVAFASLGFTAFYLAGKMHLFCERKQLSLKLIVFLIPLLAATSIAISRIHDNRHHWQDVVFGSLLGLAISYLSYKAYYPKLSSEYSHKPLSKLAWQKVKTTYIRL